MDSEESEENEEEVQAPNRSNVPDSELLKNNGLFNFNIK